MSSRVLAITLSLTLLAGAAAYGQESEPLVNELLSIAAKYAREKKLREVPTARLNPGAIDALKLGARFYEVGNRWVVKFTPTDDPSAVMMTRKAAIDSSAGHVERQPIRFEFKVVEVSRDGLARLSIKALPGTEDWLADYTLDHVELLMNRQFVPVRKELHYKSPSIKTRVLAYDGGETMATGFEASPIDLPNLNRDDWKRVRDSSGAQALEFDVTDVLARPVTVVWREGELWPSLIKTNAGTAVVER